VRAPEALHGPRVVFPGVKGVQVDIGLAVNAELPAGAALEIGRDRGVSKVEHGQDPPVMVPDQTKVFSIVLAGGEGRRLSPLTLDRAKPAVPFGGNYRLIDFALSNLVNAGYRRVVVLTQYKSHSLDRHISLTWRLSTLLGNYVAPVPAQMRRGPYWFQGSADAIYQNLNLVRDECPDHVIVFGADHIYRMDPSQMVGQHIESGASVTVAALRVPIDQANQFGVIETAADGRTITAFHEKPSNAVGLPDAPDRVYASMGNYVFSAETLVDVVTLDAEARESSHDMGGNIIPMLVGSGSAQVYDFSRNEVPGATERDRGYWRDVGTLDAFYDAHMDLISVHPVFNLYNMEWPILTHHDPLPPAKFVFAEDGRTGHALDSMVCEGVIISGASVRQSVLSPSVRVHDYAEVEGSVLFSGVEVGRGAVVRNAIIDKDVVIEAGAEIGVDVESDRERHTVSAGGVVVIPKGARVRAGTPA
jgi:glucose-1-phosphate adenylyltransferase